MELDSFRITRNGFNFLFDDFIDGTPPPANPDNGSPSTAAYGVNGGLAEVDGQLVMDGTTAALLEGAIIDNMVGHSAILQTNRDSSDLIQGPAGASVVIGASSGVEALYGNVGSDTLDASAMTLRVALDGRGGDDVIIGGAGSDLVTGGLGNDFFVFVNAFGTDTITDFEDGQDLIDLTRISGLDRVDQLSLVQDGDDVVMSVIGTPADTITVQNALVAQFAAVAFLSVRQ